MEVKSANLLPEVKLQPHQEHIFDEASGSDETRKLLLWQLGSGKSLGGLSGAEGAGLPYTVVSPASLRPTWNNERQKFTDKSLPASVLSYTEVAKGKPIPFKDTIIVDEAARLKNPGSAQTTNLMAAALKAKNLFLLTGTPITNSPSDLAPLISMLKKKDISPEEFTKRYVKERTVDPSFFQKLRGITSGTEMDIANKQELKNLLKGHVDYYSPDKPVVPTTFEDYEVEMTQPQSEIYKMMFDKLPWVVRWKLQRNYPLSKDEFLKMRAFLTGPRQVGLSTLPFLKNKDPERAFNESSKLQKALSLLQERLKDDRTKALVFSNFIDAGLHPYASALERAGIPHGMFHGGLNDQQRRKLVDDYNNNRIRVALLGPSGAEGLSFKGTQLVQLLDPYWHNVRTRQQQGRGIRFDSHLDLPEELKNVTVQRFVAKLPLGLKDRLLQMVGFNRDAERVGADDILKNLSSNKDRLNDKFINLLKEVGAEKKAVAPESVLAAIKKASEYDFSALSSAPHTAGSVLSVLAALSLRKKLQQLPQVDHSAYYLPAYMTPEKVDDKKKMWKNQAELFKYGSATAVPVTAAKPSPTVTLDQGVGPKVGILDRLKEIKKFSDEGNWLEKHDRLRKLMEETPWQWAVEDDPKVSTRFVGVKHIPTSFKYHFPRELVPYSLYAEIKARNKPALQAVPDLE